MKKSLSVKELRFISKLELKGKYFFTRDEIKSNFTNANEMNVYLHRLKNKKRIIKLNKTKYFLIPIRAVNSNWSENPFILIDEIMNNKDYCVVGKAAAYYWKLIDQIPRGYDVYNIKRHVTMDIFHTKINFKKRRKKNFPKFEERTIYNHKFIIATKEEAKKWV